MKVELLEDELKHLAMAGYKLNLEERVQLKLALLKLKNATKHEQLCFWGRVAGVTKNYYIALGLNYSGSF
jgi:radial spoke head protein 9